ncbi:recombinase family protein [Antarcticimicrobium luteum]|uniref:Recombinase family protein n=1 Tax=Antarcticimicrobium luteum TaxID=2547397 RepID=A0A4R5VIR3_9RHOB|nr:recombinase family protein [Antarcticimicrobium luteum]TDK53348.1 recombinase family protein [Antarcticimicrobium luteum]
MLRGYCNDKKLDLLSIEEDDRSAAGAQGHVFRPGLQQVIKIAKEQGAKILVPSADRLARHPDVLPGILDNNLHVISVADGRRLGKKALERLIDRARRERDLISQRVREGAARAKARGVKLGNTTNLGVAQRNGAVSNAARADRKVQELADFIERTPGWEKMTLKEKVDLLNRSGLHNLISEKRNERRPWTTSSIRKPLKKVEAELELRKDLEEEEIVVAPSWAWDTSQDGQIDASNRDDYPSSQSDEHTPADIAYQDHPGFGKF